MFVASGYQRAANVLAAQDFYFAFGSDNSDPQVTQTGLLGDNTFVPQNSAGDGPKLATVQQVGEEIILQLDAIFPDRDAGWFDLGEWGIFFSDGTLLERITMTPVVPIKAGYSMEMEWTMYVGREPDG